SGLGIALVRRRPDPSACHPPVPATLGPPGADGARGEQEQEVRQRQTGSVRRVRDEHGTDQARPEDPERPATRAGHLISPQVGSDGSSGAVWMWRMYGFAVRSASETGTIEVDAPSRVSLR